MSFKLLPPEKGKCQACAVAHDPADPHDQTSLHYQYWFYAREGRWPVWKDAIAHCDPETRRLWEEEIRKIGLWKEPDQAECLPTEDHAIGRVTARKAEES